MLALRAGQSPSTRAHCWLAFLIATMVVTAGAISAAVSAPPRPLVGFSFALSSAIFTAALILAGRVMIALERGRRTCLAAFAACGPAADTATHRGEHSAATERT